MDNPKVEFKGHRSKVKVTRSKKLYVRSRLTVLHVMLEIKGHMGQGQRSHGSGSQATWVRVKGHMGQDQHKGYNIGRWAQVNVKLLHYYLGLFFLYKMRCASVIFQHASCGRI